MKKTAFIICISFIVISCNGQSQGHIYKLSDVKSKIENIDFYKFLNSFPEKKLPFNSKKEISIENKIPSRISKKDVIKFLLLKESNIYYEIFDYDSDEDVKSNFRKEQTDYYPIILIPTNFYLIIVYGSVNGLQEYPHIYNHIIIYDYQNNIIDSMNIVSNWEPDSKWNEYVIINPNHFKLFKYDLDKNNYTSKGDVIDEKGVRNICIIEDYMIDEKGKIIKTKTEKKYLREENYNFYDPKRLPDDPINRY